MFRRKGRGWAAAAGRRVLAAVRGAALLIAAVVIASMALVAFAWAVHGLVLVFRAIP